MATHKKCSICHETKSIDEFGLNRAKKDSKQAFCKQCNKERLKAHYKLNKQKYRDKNRRHRARNREFVRRVSVFVGCQICGYNRCPEALHFHHIDPNNKERDVASMIARMNGRNVLKKEMRKCIILCSRCHAELHAGIITLDNIG
jgi:hypothetical protein